MSNSRRKHMKRTHNVVFFGHLELSNIIDWLLVCLLIGTLSWVTFQQGGVFAQTQLISIWLIGVCFILHAIAGFIRKKEEGADPQQNWGLIFVPLLVFLVFSAFFYSPVAWVARSECLILLQAIAIFWIALHSFNSDSHLWFAFAVLMLVALTNVFVGFGQYYQETGSLFSLVNPIEVENLPGLAPPLLKGVSSGTFASPSSFSALMLIALFPAMVAACARHLSPALRWCCGYLAFLFLFALFLSLNLAAIIAIIPGAILLPWMTVVKQRKRYLAYAILCAIAIAMLSLFTIFSSEFRAIWIGGSDIMNKSILWAAAWNGLSEIGIVGFILLFAPLAFVMWHGFRAWKQYPSLVMVHEKKNGKHIRVMPTLKLFLAATLLALLSLGIHLFMAFDLQVPAIVFWSALFLAIVIKSIPKKSPNATILKPARSTTFTISCVLALAIPLLSTHAYIAEIYAVEGERLNEEISSHFNTYRNNPEVLQMRIDLLQNAIDYNPQHADAHALLSRAHIERQYLKPTERSQIGSQAEKYARNAIAINDDTAVYWSHLGDALAIQGKTSEANEAYQRALEMAPNNYQLWMNYAYWLNSLADQQEDALYAINQALALNPNDTQAKAIKQKILIP